MQPGELCSPESRNYDTAIPDVIGEECALRGFLKRRVLVWLRRLGFRYGCDCKFRGLSIWASKALARKYGEAAELQAQFAGGGRFGRTFATVEPEGPVAAVTFLEQFSPGGGYGSPAA